MLLAMARQVLSLPRQAQQVLRQVHNLLRAQERSLQVNIVAFLGSVQSRLHGSPCTVPETTGVGIVAGSLAWMASATGTPPAGSLTGTSGAALGVVYLICRGGQCTGTSFIS